MKISELEQHIGEYIDITRPSTSEEKALHGFETWGAGGVLVKVWEENGLVWCELDWGMAWPITSDSVVAVGGESKD